MHASGKKLNLIATCTPGLEELTVKELEEKFGVKGANVVHKGCVEFLGNVEDIFKLNYFGKTIHRVVVLLAKQKGVESLEDIYKICKSVDYSVYISKDQSFAVKTKRFGEHNFTSMDISAKIGQAVIDKYLENKGERLKVNLKNPDVRILAELYNDSFWLGVDTTGVSLHKRWYKEGQYITSLRATIAHAMILLCGLEKSTMFYDPMCGTGTIVIEAYHFLSGMPNLNRDFDFKRFNWIDLQKFFEIKEEFKPNHFQSKIIASDKNKNALRIARENAERGKAKINFCIYDARDFLINSDVICTDLPYGIRHKHVDINNLYKKFFRRVEKTNAEKLVVLTADRCLKHIPYLRKYELKKSIRFIYGDLNARIILFERE